MNGRLNLMAWSLRTAPGRAEGSGVVAPVAPPISLTSLRPRRPAPARRPPRLAFIQESIACAQMMAPLSPVKQSRNNRPVTLRYVRKEG